MGGAFFSYLTGGFLLGKGSTSCRNAQDGILLLPRDAALRVDDVHVRHEHGGQLSRDCRPYGVWLLPYDGERRARGVRRL